MLAGCKAAWLAQCMWHRESVIAERAAFEKPEQAQCKPAALPFGSNAKLLALVRHDSTPHSALAMRGGSGVPFAMRRGSDPAQHQTKALDILNQPSG